MDPTIRTRALARVPRAAQVLAGACLLALGAGCGGGGEDEGAPAPAVTPLGPAAEPPEGTPGEADPAANAEGDTDPAELEGADLHGGPSNAGTYRVRWRPEPSPIPLNEGFSLEVWVADAEDPELALEAVELEVDAGMPDHGHGMIRTPRVTRLEAGHFEVEGMLFHMPGYWELYFDVRRGALSERAQFAVELE